LIWSFILINTIGFRELMKYIHFIPQDEWIVLIRWISSCDQLGFLFPLPSSSPSLFFPNPSLTNDFSNVQMLVDSSMTLCQMNQHELDWDRSFPLYFYVWYVLGTWFFVSII
jgi:hypothetical protein